MSQATVQRNFLALGAGEIAARLIAFGATVYVARVLGAGAYGVVALAGAVLLYFSYLVDLGIESVGVAEVARDRSRSPSLAPALLAVRAGAGGILAALLALAGLLVLPQPEGAVLALYGLTLPVRGLNARWVLIGQDRAGAASLARVAGEATSALLILALVRGTGDVATVPVTQLLGDAVAAVVLLLALRPAVTDAALRSAWATARPVLRDSWPVVGNSLLSLLVFNADLILLRLFRDSTVVGWYAAAYTLVSFLGNLGLTFAFAMMPQVARSRAEPRQAEPVVRQSLLLALALTLPLPVGGLFVATELMRMAFGDGYVAAGPPMVVLLWSVPLGWLRLVGQLSLVALGRQRAVLAVTAVGAVLTVAGDLLLIPRYGMAGAAWVTVAAEGVRLVVLLALVQATGLRLPGPGAWWRPVLGTAAMGALLLAWRGPALLMVAAGAVAYAVTLLATGAVRRGPDGRPGIRL